MKKGLDQFGTPIKTYDDFLMSLSAQGQSYDRARAGRWKQREEITQEEQAKIYKIETD